MYLIAALPQEILLSGYLYQSTSNMSSNGHTTFCITDSESSCLMIIIIKLLTRSNSTRLQIRRHMMLVDLHATAIWLWSAIGLVEQWNNMKSFISLVKAGHGIKNSASRWTIDTQTFVYGAWVWTNGSAYGCLQRFVCAILLVVVITMYNDEVSWNIIKIVNAVWSHYEFGEVRFDSYIFMWYTY